MALIRSLRWLLLLGLVALAAGIGFSLHANARPAPRPPADDPVSRTASGNRVAQQASNVEMLRTRRGAPTLRMRARESTTYTNGRLDLAEVTFRIFDPEGRETVIEAPTAVMSPDADEPAASPAGPPPRPAAARPESGVGSWTLSGGVKVTAGDGLTLAMATLEYDESHAQARTSDPVSFTRGGAAGSAVGMTYDVGSQEVRFQEAVQASMTLGSMGQVRVEAAAATHDLRQRSFQMQDYRAVTERGETLTGAKLTALFHEGSGLDRLEGDQGFVLETSHAVPGVGPASSPLARLLALEGTRTMRGRRLAVVFDGGPQPVSLEISGEANLTASDVDSGGAPASIAAQTLTFDLTRGSLSRAHATGSVDLRGAPAAGQASGFRLRSDDLMAALDPNSGQIQNLEGLGEIQLSDQDMESQGNRTVLDPNANMITLTGKEGEPATATWLGRKIQAQRIEADRKRKTLAARGGVRASYQPPAPAPGEPSKDGSASLPFFRGGDTIYAMAGSLTFADQGRIAHYRDRVRLWQGDNRIEAAEIDLNETAGTLEARGEVISTFRQPPPAPAPSDAAQGAAPPATRNPSDDIVTVAAAAMKYDRAANTILYSGRVLVTQGSTRVTGDTAIVTLSAGGGSAERMETVGNVEMRDQGRNGRGDRLVVDLKANTLKLSGTGREAVVQDDSGQQVVRGSALTMDRTGDRIFVESELGGRTWITLKPRQKGAPGLGPDPHN